MGASYRETGACVVCGSIVNLGIDFCDDCQAEGYIGIDTDGTPYTEAEQKQAKKYFNIVFEKIIGRAE